MIVPELLLATAAKGREADRPELASQTAYLLGVLGQVGTGLGLRPPNQGLAGLQGLRLWSLKLRGLHLPAASSAGPE